ncbi:MAG: sigma 54-interacting transcriptional regulator [Myxococcota bacterium]
MRDLGSKNGTRLNGAPVRGEARAAPGDEIRAGELLRLQLAPEDPLAWAVARVGRLHGARSDLALLRILTDEVAAETGARHVWALQWEGEGRRRRYRALVTGGELDPAALPAPADVPTSIVGRAARSDRAVWTDDARGDPRFGASESVHALSLHAVGAVPVGERTVLYLAGDVPFSAATRARIEALCGLAARMRAPAPPPPPDPDPEPLPGIVARSPAMHELAQQLRTFARLGYRILLLGARGTGKSQLARAIHALSGVAGPFVHADCPNLVPTLAESLLFGHERGAFANATQRHEGWVERAAGGTLFLDEVGELPPELQPKLLALLEEGTFERVGGRERLRFTGRVIAATNRPIDADGSFRGDLFDRLAQVVIRVPPLAERPEDVALLARRFFDEEAARVRGLGAEPPEALTDEAVAVLVRSPLEGNVRELRSLVVRGLGQAMVEQAGAVQPQHLLAPQGPPSGDYWAQVHAFERSLLLRALAASEGNQTAARKALGLSNGAWDRAKKRTGL